MIVYEKFKNIFDVKRVPYYSEFGNNSLWTEECNRKSSIRRSERIAII
ncbi:hypothetical protein [Lachnospira pectinoschiza]|nr:hypothetical protein [Lachnospira pectinoschiza]